MCTIILKSKRELALQLHICRVQGIYWYNVLQKLNNACQHDQEIYFFEILLYSMLPFCLIKKNHVGFSLCKNRNFSNFRAQQDTEGSCSQIYVRTIYYLAILPIIGMEQKYRAYQMREWCLARLLASHQSRGKKKGPNRPLEAVLLAHGSPQPMIFPPFHRN